MFDTPPSDQVASVAATVTSPFYYSFNSAGTIYETSNINLSTSPYWWIDSGAKMVISGNTGATVHNSLPANDYWRVLYGKNNPLDTDSGYHPQNIFRLVSRNTWHNFDQQMYYKIDADNLSASPNRSISNGLLLFNRYKDSQNLYYAGLRVDGTAVIKKKTNSVYYTLAQTKIFPGTYNASTSPNLLPHNNWIGIKTEVTTTTSGTVLIKLYDDVGKTGNWKLLLQATDDGKSYGGAVINGNYYVGVRTDFMDVSFENYQISSI